MLEPHGNDFCLRENSGGYQMEKERVNLVRDQGSGSFYFFWN